MTSMVFTIVRTNQKCIPVANGYKYDELLTTGIDYWPIVATVCKTLVF
jgi:hypothetical protein